MSTSWGFDLDMSAVRLMRRDAGDWQEVAVEKIEGADIESRLMAMVERIEGDAGCKREGQTVKNQCSTVRNFNHAM